MPPIAFYVLVWVFAVQHPGGEVTNRTMFFSNRLSLIECNSKATEAAAKIPLENLTEDGGNALYSRFVCVPVPGVAG